MSEGEESKRMKTKAELKSRIKIGYRSTDPHKEIYNKEAHEFKYTDQICPICGNRIDEKGMCACGAGGS